MKTPYLFIICLSFTATAAFAQNDGQGQQSTDTRQALTFEEIRGACQNPAKFHNQVAPSNIQITCHDQMVKWVPSDQGTFPLETKHYVTASISSDKYASKAVDAVLTSSPQVTACPTFKEVNENVDTVRSVSCADLIAYPGNMTDFCAAAATTLKSQNPSAKQEQDSGRTINFCAQPSLLGSSQN